MQFCWWGLEDGGQEAGKAVFDVVVADTQDPLSPMDAFADDAGFAQHLLMVGERGSADVQVGGVVELGARGFTGRGKRSNHGQAGGIGKCGQHRRESDFIGCRMPLVRRAGHGAHSKRTVAFCRRWSYCSM